MKKTNLLAVIIATILILATNCKKEEVDYALPTNEWGNLTLVLDEPGVVKNTWIFNTTGGSGKATLQTVGEFNYTYTKDGVNKSTLKFDVQGEDKFEMTWTSATGGTFKEYFNETFGSDGTFTITKN